MAIKKGTSREAKMSAIRAFMGIWVEDQAFYCNTCGTPYTGKRGKWQCDSKRCSSSQVGRNVDHLKGVCAQNKMIKEELMHNELGTSESGALRYAVSMPVQLLKDLEKYFRTEYDEELFNDKHDLRSFMRTFPELSIARRI